MPQDGSLLPHTENFKCLDVSLDLLEFLLTSLPESLVDQIEGLLRWLLKIKAANRGGESVLCKVQDMLSLAQEMLSADVLLPNLVAIITTDMLTPSK